MKISTKLIYAIYENGCQIVKMPFFHSCGCKLTSDVLQTHLERCALHTAAPELLEAARGILKRPGKAHPGTSTWEALSAAIAKAEGK